MRNLKKFLALMLAMIMAMSLMITANATSTAEDFADNAGITPEFAEAVDVLSGMRVFSGDNGNFKPAANITRAEMAAVIYRLVSGDVTDAKAGLYTNYSPFKDVTADKWYAGYVGYCWNMGLIKGRDANTFDPTGNVTGYEALAMLLRAVGYDKNGEFTGPTWQTNVSTQGQQLGILRDIATTQYGGTLHLPARRDVIASMTFRTAAYVPTVTYSPAMGYNQYVGVPVTGAGSQPQHNPTLGWKAFGLISDTGIVVGNQDTGETVTRMSFSTQAYGADPVYAYGVENLNGGVMGAKAAGGNPPVGDNVAANSIATFDAKTDLGLFAHKVQIWFDGRNTELRPAYFGQNVALDWRNSNQYNNLHTYAYFDRATLTSVVKQAEADKTSLAVNTKTPGTLGNKAAAAGFNISASTEVEQNMAFSRFLPVADTDSPAATEHIKVSTIDATYQAPNKNTSDPATFTENLYLLISNSENKALDVVIALNIQVSEISGVDNVNAIKTVTIPEVDTDPEFIADENKIGQGSYMNGATIEQGQLVPGSTTTLGQYEIGVHIDGTGPSVNLPQSSVVDSTDVAPGYDPSLKDVTGTTVLEDAWFKLVPVTNTKDGTVVSYNPNTGKVVLQDGTVLDRSILYNSVVPGTIPQVGATETYQNANYRFYLTPEGKYLGAEQIYGNTFLYGTYMDYQTVTSSSTFEYYLTGVKLDGTTDTVRVSTLNNRPINSTIQLGVPFRDTYGASGTGTQAINGLGKGVYRGFVIGGTNANWTFEALDNIGVIAGDNNNADGGTMGAPNNPADQITDPTNEPEVIFDGDAANGGNQPITIGSTQLKLGAAYAGTLNMKNAADPGNSQELYFTENTKFIVVDGYGTDSLKPQVFNGLTALVGSSREVQIDLDAVVKNSATAGQDPREVTMRGILEDTVLSEMTYLTQSPFVYAQNRVLSRQADVIILPATAILREESTTLRYVGNATMTLYNADDDATQFTMYNNGVAESVWIDGKIDTAAGTRNSATLVGYGTTGLMANPADRNHDHFWRLLDTGRTANDGKPIYTVAIANLDWTQNIYTASTMNAQTGTFECTISGTSRTANISKDMLRVDSANITNLNVLNPNPTWPGINSLATLNYAGSLGDYSGNEHGGVDTLYVSAIVSDLTATQIYVCYNQSVRHPF